MQLTLMRLGMYEKSLLDCYGSINLLAARTPLCTSRGAVLFAEPKHFTAKLLTQIEPEFAGLSTFDPFPDGNASQVDTRTCFGKQILAHKFRLYLGKYLWQLMLWFCKQHSTSTRTQRLVFGGMYPELRKKRLNRHFFVFL